MNTVNMAIQSHAKVLTETEQMQRPGRQLAESLQETRPLCCRLLRPYS